MSPLNTPTPLHLNSVFSSNFPFQLVIIFYLHNYPSRKRPLPNSRSAFWESAGFKYLCNIGVLIFTPRIPLRIGVSTCMSKGCASTYPGSFSWISATNTEWCWRRSVSGKRNRGSYYQDYRLSLIDTVDIYYDITLMPDGISSSDFATGNVSWTNDIFQCFPGPTLGSWSTSPKIRSCSYYNRC